MTTDETGRKVPEWIGKNSGSVPPNRVRLRIVRRYNGLCYLTGRPIAGEKWQLDHIVALINGGENRESNLAPAIQSDDGHKAKTARDVAIKAKNDARAKSHYGIVSSPRKKIESRGFAPSMKKARISKPPVIRVKNFYE